MEVAEVGAPLIVGYIGCCFAIGFHWGATPYLVLRSHAFILREEGEAANRGSNAPGQDRPGAGRHWNSSTGSVRGSVRKRQRRGQEPIRNA